MDKLKRLQEAFKRAFDRLTEIRKLEGEALTAEIRTERDGLLVDAEQLKTDIDVEKRLIEVVDDKGEVH